MANAGRPSRPSRGRRPSTPEAPKLAQGTGVGAQNTWHGRRRSWPDRPATSPKPNGGPTPRPVPDPPRTATLTDVAIRLATTTDVDAISAIDPRASVGSERYTEIERAAATAECFVEERDGTIAGYVILDRSFFGFPFVALLIVDEGSRRRGIGTALMRHAESITPGGKLFTSTNESNAPMQRLCESLGFVPSGRVENLDDGDPELVYFKQISELAK
jgi:GNAT superfamily N-acetyltransferase